MKKSSVISNHNYNQALRNNQNISLSFFKSFIQPKLNINQPNDIYEHEADAMADKVTRMPANKNEAAFFQPANISFLQRKCTHCEDEEKLQMKSEGSPSGGMGVPLIVHDVIKSSGQPLDAGTRGFMESRFGYDFGNVQVHNDSLAHQSSADINALAYNNGNHVVFGAGQYQPDSNPGLQLLAHELVHVVQQSGSDQVSTGVPLVQRRPKRKPGRVVRVEFDGVLSDSQYQDWIAKHPNVEKQHIFPNGDDTRTTDKKFSREQLRKDGFYYARRLKYEKFIHEIWLNDNGAGKQITIYSKTKVYE